jgi:glycosyltransferase involved in cell wall biosynthesis
MLTVVIASAGYGHLAAHCIESVLCQTRPADKILFVDDAFGDCAALQDKYSLEWIFRPNNLGVTDNFQEVLMHRVHTEYVIFVGADNWLRPDTLELVTEKIKETSADIITYDTVITGTDRRNIVNNNPECRPYQGDFYWSRENDYHGSMAYRVDLAKRLGGYVEARQWSLPAEDLGLWTRLKAGGAQVAHIPQGLLYYRRHKHNFYKY